MTGLRTPSYLWKLQIPPRKCHQHLISSWVVNTGPSLWSTSFIKQRPGVPLVTMITTQRGMFLVQVDGNNEREGSQTSTLITFDKICQWLWNWTRIKRVDCGLGSAQGGSGHSWIWPAELQVIGIHNIAHLKRGGEEAFISWHHCKLPAVALEWTN